MKYIFSQKNLNYFVNDALKNKEGKTHLETLAIGVGKLHQENCIVVDLHIYYRAPYSVLVETFYRKPHPLT